VKNGCDIGSLHETDPEAAWKTIITLTMNPAIDKSANVADGTGEIDSAAPRFDDEMSYNEVKR
jgi:hypothetical protein